MVRFTARIARFNFDRGLQELNKLGRIYSRQITCN